MKYEMSYKFVHEHHLELLEETATGIVNLNLGDSGAKYMLSS